MCKKDQYHRKNCPYDVSNRMFYFSWRTVGVRAANQSCGSWTIFLYKHFLLFQQIYMAAVHVSKHGSNESSY